MKKRSTSVKRGPGRIAFTLKETYVVDPATGCWEWIRYRSKAGYGRHGPVNAHRWVYEQLVGPIPEGLQLDHLCRNRGCVNPKHLEPVTMVENLRRGAAAHQLAKTHCPKGHEYTPENIIWQGRNRTCRACNYASHRRWYAENRERIRAQERARYAERKAAAR